MMLPFNLKPTLGTYLYMAYPFGMVETPQVPNTMLNWNVQLMFRGGKVDAYTQNLAMYPALNIYGYARLGLLATEILLAGRASAVWVKSLGDLVIANLSQSRYRSV